MLNQDQWFTEICKEGHSAFSFEVNKKLCEEKTPYQKIGIYETKFFGNLMVIDDFVMLTAKDNFLYHEMLTHPALFTHAEPKNVIIIGGGDCGTLQEVLKHESIETAIQIEIDERVTRLSEQYFPELCTANHDSRASLLFEDGIAWMKNAPADSADLIIVDSTDPIGPAEGLFTKAFYQDCLKVLREDGLLVQQSESPLYHFKSITLPMRHAMQEAGFLEVRTLPFPQPCYPSGWWSCTLAGKNLGTFRQEASLHKRFATQYYTLAIHQAAISELPLFNAD